MGNSEREIESLIYAYAERFDLGDLDGVAALFSDGRIQAAPGVVYEPPRCPPCHRRFPG